MTVRALSKGHRIAFVPWARVGEMCPVSFAAFYKQRLRWAMGWEQCTFRRMVAVFNSTAIPETRKWQTALLLVMRYWSISTAAFAATMIIIRQVTELATGRPVYQSSPLLLVEVGPLMTAQGLQWSVKREMKCTTRFLSPVVDVDVA